MPTVINVPQKARVSIGYSRGNATTDYKNQVFKSLVGADITATDGLGNKIEAHVREGRDGCRIELNGKTIFITPE